MNELEMRKGEELEAELQRVVGLLSSWITKSAQTTLLDDLSVAQYRDCMKEIEDVLRAWVVRTRPVAVAAPTTQKADRELGADARC